MKFKIKYSDQIVGFFSIIALSALILLIFSLGAKQKWFTKKITYTSTFNTATNLSEGMSLHYKGFSVGQIKTIRLTKEQKVDVSFYILEDYFELVTYGSILELVVSPIGLGKQLLFHPGTTKKILPAEAHIPTKDSAEGKELIKNGFASIPPQEDVIASLVASVSDLLDGLNITISEANDLIAGKNATELGQSLKSLSVVLKNAEGISKQLEILSTNISDPTGLVPKLVQSDGTISTLFNDRNQLYNTIDSVLNNVDLTITNVKDISSSLKGNTPQITSILQEVEILLLKVQDVMEGLKNNPLLKGGISRTMEEASSSPILRDTEF